MRILVANYQVMLQMKKIHGILDMCRPSRKRIYTGM